MSLGKGMTAMREPTKKEFYREEPGREKGNRLAFLELEEEKAC